MALQMNEKQRRFADLYIETGKGTDSYQEVYGCKRTTATNMASVTLRKPHVAKYIRDVMDGFQKEGIASAYEIMRFLTDVMRGEITADINGLKNPENVQMKPNFKDRIKAGELLARRYGLFSETINIVNEKPTILTGSDEIDD